MGNFDGKFTSAIQDWETPQMLFDILNNEFDFDIDLAASKDNTKCKLFYSLEDDAFDHIWKGICWLNPPYGLKTRNLKDWIKKAWDETRKEDCTVVMLIPTRTNTNWWHEYCMKASDIRFLRGRPKFNNSNHGLPQPLAIIIFRNAKSLINIESFDVREIVKTKGEDNEKNHGKRSHNM